MTEREIYKGIEFVRISNLPKEQSERIKASFPKEKIIMILRDEVLLKDCIQYCDYQEWFKASNEVVSNVVADKTERILTHHSFNLALK